VAGSESPASVLDASALFAHLNDEPGAAVVREFLANGAAISAVHWIEVLTKLADRGEDPDPTAAELRGAGLIGTVVSVEALSAVDCVAIARLRRTASAPGLSLADHDCLVLAARLKAPALPQTEPGRKEM
jgi:PIN domain nuclease of toxin-antitoxin system